ncbi:MAG: Arm DNA-binding domain-containing protein [Nitrospinota bacterium]
MAFTSSRIKSIRKQKKRKIIWEGGTGLGVRVSPAGLKTFIFMYRHDRVARMMSFGSYPKISLADARLKLAEAKKKLENNIDPAKESVERKRKELNAETIGDLAQEYLEKYARPNKRSVKEDERILRVDIIPVWGRHKAKSITKRDVITLLDGIVERGSPIAANRTFALVRKMFNFAISRDILQSNPCFCLKAPSKENQRDRVLTEDEIKAFWNGLNL